MGVGALALAPAALAAPHPDIAVFVTPFPDEVQLGQTVYYTVGVRNIGTVPVPASEVVVTSSAGTTLAPLNGDDSLDPGERWGFGLPGGATYSRVATTCGAFGTTISAAVVPGEPNDKVANNAATGVTQVLCGADLGIEKRADTASAPSGATVSWTVRVTNLGGVAVPTSQVLVSDPTLGTLQMLTEPVPETLGPGDFLEWRGSETLTAQMCGTHRNTASVSITPGPGVPSDQNTSNDTTTADMTVTCPEVPPPPVVPPVVTPPPTVTGTTGTRLRISKSGPRRVYLRQVRPWTITVTNAGRVTARGVTLTDRLPGGLALAKRTGGVRVSNGTLSWRLGNLAPGARRSVTVQLWTTAGSGWRTNRASARATNARLVSAGARTLLLGIPAPVQPAVTG
jgi:uncharacterized repeat protein (TIGR01451 family)